MNRCCIPLFFICVITLCSCGQTKNKRWNEKTEAIVEKWSGEKMPLPDSMYIISFGTLDQYDITQKGNTLKVATFVDGSCSACMVNLAFWKDFMIKIYKERKDCRFYFFIDLPEYNTQENTNPLLEVGFECPWILDLGHSYFQKNEIYDPRLQTVLLNKNDEVILIGDPTLNEGLAQLYYDVICNYEN
ncbi:MAG: hypothetical protein LBG19_12240 [Prevotellaceae bacterium]|jgi:hypothetical protein|nr:hypothetical protein [Prevotellaceae bacterium]